MPAGGNVSAIANRSDDTETPADFAPGAWTGHDEPNPTFETGTLDHPVRTSGVQNRTEGGGTVRQSTDPEWSYPPVERMLRITIRPR